MQTLSISMFSALLSVRESFERADRLMYRAVEEVNRGDIVDAVLAIKQAEITAKGGAAVARAADEISKAVLDILA
jgi:hypothetical protein